MFGCTKYYSHLFYSKRVGDVVGSASGRLDFRIPGATDLSRKRGSVSSTTKRSAID